MMGYDRTIKLAHEQNTLALECLKRCYVWVAENGRDATFAGRWILGGVPVLNLSTLRARGILERVGSSRGGHRAYYRIVDPDGVGRALVAIGLI
ncbi:hypothetical protein [Candidatus Binatus sp.]|uniref:hypothetical protein n=1 Tax=Candidatus Binatus sp. TaxID=2811406 RepID=UPI003CC518A1